MVRILFAGCESQYDVMPIKPKKMMISYYYVNKRPESQLPTMRENADFIIIDSGAFTFMAAKGAQGVRPASSMVLKNDPIPYTHEYCKWLVENKESFDYYVEMDIARVYPWQMQLDLRQIFVDYNLDPMPVYHLNNDETFESLCQKHDFVGIGSTEQSPKLLARLLYTAEKFKTKCHLFAFTRMNLEKLAAYKSCYTVDSSTWSVGSRWGQCLYFDGLRIQRIGRKEFYRRFNHDFVQLDPRFRDEWNILQVMNFDEYLGRISSVYGEGEEKSSREKDRQ